MHNHHLKCNFFSLFSFLVLVCMLLIFFTCTHFVLKCTNFYFFFLHSLCSLYDLLCMVSFRRTLVIKTQKNLKYIFLSFYHIFVILIYLIHGFCFLEFLSLPLYESIDKDVLFIFTFLKMKKKRELIGKLTDILEITCKQ